MGIAAISLFLSYESLMIMYIVLAIGTFVNSKTTSKLTILCLMLGFCLLLIK